MDCNCRKGILDAASFGGVPSRAWVGIFKANIQSAGCTISLLVNYAE